MRCMLLRNWETSALTRQETVNLRSHYSRANESQEEKCAYCFVISVILWEFRCYEGFNIMSNNSQLTVRNR